MGNTAKGQSNYVLGALRPASIYALFSILWILTSDQILLTLVEDINVLTLIQSIKGWLFVLVTALLIFILIRNELKKVHDSADKIRKMHTLLADIIDSMPSIVFGFKLDGTIEHWNKHAEVLTKKSKVEMVGENLQDHLLFFPFKDNCIAEMMKQESHYHHQKLTVNKNEETKHYEIFMFPVSTDDEYSRIIRIDDVTKEEEAHKINSQNEKLIALGSLAAGFAHEINNPLAGIMQATQNINRRLSMKQPKNVVIAEQCNINPESLSEYLDQRMIYTFLKSIHSAGKRASGIVKNMIELNRNAIGEQRALDIGTIISDLIEMVNDDIYLRETHGLEGINIVTDISTHIPRLMCTSTHIEQMVLALITNAADSLTSLIADDCTPQITVKINSHKNEIKVAVIDNGPGIPNHLQSRIFDPFFSTKEVGKGVGMGLSTSYMMITNNYNGSLTFSSSPEQTEFILSFPI